MKNDDLFEKLHEALGEELLSRILCREATAADLNVARQFLKDNNVDSHVKEGEDHYLIQLAEDLPFEEEG